MRRQLLSAPTPLLLNHAPGTDFPTAELDHLAITPFGIFVVETKNWAGSILPGPDADTVVRVGVGGQRETRRSPLRQNRSKVGFLRSVLPGMWPVEGLGVFASDHCEVSSTLPANLIRLAGLHQWLRARKARHHAKGYPAVSVRHAWRAIQAVADTQDRRFMRIA
ncbi:nuclease-related domain-containing protein [Paraburkholderia sp. CI3]|uniref:nuclease-related domain-containing protein n=1 Tax=Paraburkholderia sp. CI3 TaxID=2991060 RepID=UPI003D1E23AF